MMAKKSDKKKKKLTPKQELFCREYMIDNHITNAAIRAGYKETSAYSMGSENMNKPEIQERIAVLKSEQHERLEITADRILQEYAALAFSNVKDFYDDKGNLLHPHQLSDLAAKAVSSFKVTKIKTEDETEESIQEYKRWDKVKGLDALAKRFGLDEPEVDTEDDKQNAKEALGILAGLFDKAYGND